ncbi:unnamed protein product, partial [Ectocarpus sp. 8 AP-2014]
VVQLIGGRLLAAVTGTIPGFRDHGASAIAATSYRHRRRAQRTSSASSASGADRTCSGANRHGFGADRGGEGDGAGWRRNGGCPLEVVAMTSTGGRRRRRSVAAADRRLHARRRQVDLCQGRLDRLHGCPGNTSWCWCCCGWAMGAIVTAPTAFVCTG